MSAINLAGEQNVGQEERIISVVGGALLALYALRRAPLTILLAVLAGAVLLYRGATGSCPFYSAMGLTSADDAPRLASHRRTEAQLDKTAADSFPASDPPGWASGSSFTQVRE